MIDPSKFTMREMDYAGIRAYLKACPEITEYRLLIGFGSDKDGALIYPLISYDVMMSVIQSIPKGHKVQTLCADNMIVFVPDFQREN